MEIYAFCLMTNHLHLLVSAQSPANLPDIIRDFKKYTNKKIVALIEQENESRRDWILYRFSYHAKYDNRIQNYKVWQDGYHGIACDNIKILSQKLDYIHNNPVKNEIVEKPEYYIYSSASSYAGENGLIGIILINTGFTL